MAGFQAGPTRFHLRFGGHGPAVLLLHGHPRTHATWYRVAEPLAKSFTVVCPDLPGYGRSKKSSSPDHIAQSKRAMADDLVALMDHLGIASFSVVGHDRGAYVAHRLAADHPERVSRLVILDSVPIGEALARCDTRFASSWWHWFFLGQLDKPAEPLINRDPDAWYRLDRERMGDENFEDAQRAIHDPEVVHAMCEDYRAGLTVDRVADDEDVRLGKKIQAPTLLVWARDGDMPTLYGDPLAVWRRWAPTVEGMDLVSGHHLSEDAPGELTEALLRFLSVDGSPVPG